MRTIWLSDKQHCVNVDDDDYDKLMQHTWHYHPSRNTGYAQTKMLDVKIGKRRTIPMHRYIMGILFDDPRQIDHIDGNGLNNQKSNLQFCNARLNAYNRPVYHKDKSIYKGVDVNNNPHKKYIARVGINYQHIHAGCFYTEKAAALAYDDKLRELLQEKDFVTRESRCFNFQNLTNEERQAILDAEKEAEYQYLSKHKSIYNNVCSVENKKKGISLWRIRKPNFLDKKRGLIGDYLEEIDAARALDYYIIQNGAEEHCKLNFEYTEEELQKIRSGALKPPKSYKEMIKSFFGVKQWHRGQRAVIINGKKVAVCNNAIEAARYYDKYVKKHKLNLPLNFPPAS